MITGAHSIVYSSDADGVRAFFRDVLELPSVDAGHGWLIFALPPSEVGVHPSDSSTRHEMCLMCDDLERTMAELRAKGIEFRGEPEEESFGMTTTMLLPGGVEILLYEPRHQTPLDI